MSAIAFPRRAVLTAALGVTGAAMLDAPAAASKIPGNPLPTGAQDRTYNLRLLERMATPVLSLMAEGRLQRAWRPDVSPTWDGRDRRVAYMEAFGRLLDGIAPWLALPDADDAEGRLRSKLRGYALASFAHAVDPASPDCLLWRGPGQALVDSAYITSALLRAPDVLWKPLDAPTKRRLIAEVKGLRRVSPPYTNWLLFAATNEAFLYSVGEDWDPVRVDLALRKFEEWYVGDGWYADGPRFHLDYYNSFVIHPMVTQVLKVFSTGSANFNALRPAQTLPLAIRRMQRYAVEIERTIGPDGAFPPIGRSATYRTAAHQPLALLAWRGELPDALPPGRVRAATSAAQRRIFADPTNFDADGFLTIGFARRQPSLGDIYSNAGSMYIASESLIALGLPASDPFWNAASEPWTMRLAYGGADFHKDYPVDF